MKVGVSEWEWFKSVKEEENMVVTIAKMAVVVIDYSLSPCFLSIEFTEHDAVIG